MYGRSRRMGPPTFLFLPDRGPLHRGTSVELRVLERFRGGAFPIDPGEVFILSDRGDRTRFEEGGRLGADAVLHGTVGCGVVDGQGRQHTHGGSGEAGPGCHTHPWQIVQRDNTAFVLVRELCEAVFGPGCMFSLSPRILARSKDKVRRLLDLIPDDRLLLESDAPHQGRFFTGMGDFVRSMADVKGCPPHDLARNTYENLERTVG